jgi:mannose-6-phosphate isomerase-like protein (cupin superfamily)
MPVVKNYHYEDIPAWSELKKYERLKVIRNTTPLHYINQYDNCEIFVLSGSCKITDSSGTVTELSANEHGPILTKEFDISAKHGYFIDSCDIVVLCGKWEYAKIGLFRVDQFENPINNGSPCGYYRNSGFDNHYHDFDEMWIIVKGSGVAMTEDKLYEVEAGDCVLTRKGNNHDYPIVHMYTEAICFENLPRGLGRSGHLWIQRDGINVPETS